MKQTSNGRSMIEMLCVLAIIGLLSAVTLWIITRAQTKNRVNLLLHDVSVAFLELAEKNDDGVYGITFTPESSKQIMVEKGFYNDGKITGVVIVNGIDQSECQMIAENNKLDKMTFWQIDETEAGYLKRPLICADDTQIIFTQDYQNIYTCNNGCPDEAECNYENECKCPRGYVIDAQTGTCEVLECPIVSKIENIQDYDCCYKYYGVWDEVQGCYCQEGEYFNSQRCTPYGSFCSYKYTAGKSGAIMSDCSYEYTAGNVSAVYSDCSYEYHKNDSTGVLSSSQARGGCPLNTYCALHWEDSTCNTAAGTQEGKIYGVCTPMNNFYTICKSDVVSPQVVYKKRCTGNTYCALNWSNDTCTSGLGSGSGILYGVCTPMDNFYTICSQKNTLPKMEVLEKCFEDSYCSLIWKDKKCSEVGNDEGIIYGSCLSLNGNSDQVCPATE